MIDTEDSFDDIDNNPLLRYCFGELYGENYGVRTLLEYDEECTIGDTCLANGTLIDEESEVLRPKRGNLNDIHYQRTRFILRNMYFDLILKAFVIYIDSRIGTISGNTTKRVSLQ